MREKIENNRVTRRAILIVMASAGAGAAGVGRLYAFSSDFWNKKQPGEWSSEEIEQLTTKSPWAKEVSASGPAQGGRGGYPGGGGGGYPGGGGGGYPGGGGGYPGGGGGYPGGIGGIGGMGRRGRGPGASTQSYKGTVRWESAKPILEALKYTLPDAFKDHYVISVSGLPLTDSGRRSRSQDPDQESSQSQQDMLDHLKGSTSLQPKDKRDVQPGVVQQPISAGYGTILFGFSKESLTLKAEDKEVTFTSEFGRLNVKAKFNLKDMMYHDELAV